MRDEVRRGPVAVREPAAGARLAADPDAHDRMVLDHAGRVLNALGAVTGDPVQGLPVRHLHGHVRARGEERGRREQRHPAPDAGVAGRQGERQRHDEQRDHARLGVGEQEARPHQHDQGDQRPGAPAPRGQHRERHADAEHHVPAVQARVAEQRRHAEVVGVRVRRREVGRVEEQLVRGGLPQARRPRRSTPSRARCRRASAASSPDSRARATRRRAGRRTAA